MQCTINLPQSYTWLNTSLWVRFYSSLYCTLCFFPLCLLLNKRRENKKVPHYLRQVNEVNAGDTVFVRCVSVCLCVCVHSGPVNQTSLKRLKLRTSNLTRMFPVTVRTCQLKNYEKFTWWRYALSRAPSSIEYGVIWRCMNVFLISWLIRSDCILHIYYTFYINGVFATPYIVTCVCNVQGKLFGAHPSLGLYMYNNDMVGQPPPAHTGIPPLHVDPKTGTCTALLNIL